MLANCSAPCAVPLDDEVGSTLVVCPSMSRLVIVRQASTEPVSCHSAGEVLVIRVLGTRLHLLSIDGRGGHAIVLTIQPWTIPGGLFGFDLMGMTRDVEPVAGPDALVEARTGA
jgi:hypothetical protein